MTQGGPIYPTILNVVVYVVLQHWVTVVAAMEVVVCPGADGMEFFGSYVQRLTDYFYVDDGILALTWAIRLQRESDLTELFYCVGLCTNVARMLIMDFHPYPALAGHSSEAYGLLMMGKRYCFRDQLRQRFGCPDCDADLEAGYLAFHRKVHRRVAHG